jgi:outer membrane protein assembly factor BamA
MGVFRFSYAIPLNSYEGDIYVYPDEEERFQFSMGRAF